MVVDISKVGSPSPSNYQLKVALFFSFFFSFYSFLIIYFLYLHFKCFLVSPFLVSPLKTPYPQPPPPFTNPPTPASWPWQSPILGHRAFTGPTASPPIDERWDFTPTSLSSWGFIQLDLVQVLCMWLKLM
jgi:hypothetical protein